jgi:hypothetical protein
LFDSRYSKEICYITMLPASLKASLREHLKRVKMVHEKDLSDGWGQVSLPHALDRKYPFGFHIIWTSIS